jgi:hypothetical protein
MIKKTLKESVMKIDTVPDNFDCTVNLRPTDEGMLSAMKGDQEDQR